MWCSYVTRAVGMKSAEAQTDAAQRAIRDELDGLRKKKVWDESEVREYHDLRRDPNVPEALIGRVFGIFGVKNSEMPAAHHKWKARIVFQGNRVTTKSGTSPWDIYEEVSNCPATFLGARCALGAKALLGHTPTLRDAEQAYLQARIDQEGRTQTWIELPEQW